MLEIEITHADGQVRTIEAPDTCVIGKGAQNEIRLVSWRVGREHARLFTVPAGVLLEDMGAFSGVHVNGERIESQYGPLKSSDLISIGPFRLRLVASAPGESSDDARFQETTAFGQSALESPPRNQKRLTTAPAPSSWVDSSAAPKAKELVGVPHPARAATDIEATKESHADALRKQIEFNWRQRVHARLLETMDLRRHDVHGMSDEQLREETEAFIREILKDQETEIPRDLDRERLCSQVLNEAVGLGPLEELLCDDGVSEIMVNRYDEIYVERSGRLERHPLTFTGDRAVMGVIERIVAPLGRRIDESSPMVDARLKDGSRVNAIIPPLALKGPCLTIRKFAKRKLTAQDLVNFGALSPDMATFLEVCVVGRKNIVVSGGTGSGKTTLLNILSNFIPARERIITVEDAAELKLHHEHLISLESRPPNVEGKGSVLIRDLVKNTLRMRPDRIVVGECRGAEALDMLQAMNTGHEGSLTTLHANTPRDGLARLETMVLMAGMDLPLMAIREQIASAVDVIVQQTRFACGTRAVTSITELTGMESGKIQIQEVFRFHSQGYTGHDGKVRGFFTGCDIVPSFYEELRATGNDLDMAIFKPAQPLAAVDDFDSLEA